jgi:hypothetical protein
MHKYNLKKNCHFKAVFSVGVNWMSLAQTMPNVQVYPVASKSIHSEVCALGGFILSQEDSVIYPGPMRWWSSTSLSKSFQHVSTILFPATWALENYV